MAYKQVYFRIRSAYDSRMGYLSDEDRKQFRQESSSLFQEAGWTLCPSQGSGVCDTVIKGEQELYLHPMNFSGVIEETEVPVIEALLTQATTFRCYHTDLYATYLEMNDDAYRTYLESQRDEIIMTILNRYKTKRRNLYITASVALDVAQKFSVHRICDKNGTRDIAKAFVLELVEQLLKVGQLVAAKTKNGVGMRTATAADPKPSAII